MPDSNIKQEYEQRLARAYGNNSIVINRLRKSISKYQRCEKTPKITQRLTRQKEILFYALINKNKKGMKIKTSNICPPIPIRKYDWEAVREGYEEGDPIGQGETEQEAIKDLLEKEEEHLD